MSASKDNDREGWRFSTSRRALAFVFAVAVALLAGAAAAEQAPVPASADFSFFGYLTGRPAPALIAFNPSGYDPRTPAASYPIAEIRADLTALRPAFDGLVLYSHDPAVTDAIAAEAAALGYRAILLGIWDPKSDAEIDATARLIARYRHRLALAVVIGNEGINDNRYDMDDLERAETRLRTQIGTSSDASSPAPRLPVSTSEPAGDYGWPPLRAFGDFLAPNIHPAIDRATLSPADAVSWVRARARAIAEAANKPVLIKETGMPHGGSEGFTPERQATFWQAWLARGRLEALPGRQGVFMSAAAAFEAFDAPWKAQKLASTMEGAWGLMSVDRHPYPAFGVWAEAR